MPLIKSAKKAIKTTKRQTEENRLARAKIKDALKGARIAITAGDKDVAEKISKAYRELDIAAKKKVIHKNKASRLKSRLAKKLATTKPTEVKPAKKATKKKTAK
jgi:small subunit ribosomal protein S20